MRHYQSKVLVVFADMQPIDNMMVQIANEMDKKTITMQHGLYIDYKDFSTVNSVNYLNAVAKTFLAWGEDTATLINKYHPSITIEIMGKPIYIEKPLEKSCFFTIVFDSNYFFEHNLELLKIAYGISDILGLKVNLKLHPNNKIEWFKLKDDLTLIDADIMASRFVLGHTTTMLYDCMFAGIPSFRYKTDKPSNNTLSILEFDNVKECINILNNQEIMSLNFSNIGRYYFKYVSEESRKKYAEYFRTLDKQIDS